MSSAKPTIPGNVPSSPPAGAPAPAPTPQPAPSPQPTNQPAPSVEASSPASQPQANTPAPSPTTAPPAPAATTPANSNNNNNNNNSNTNVGGSSSSSSGGSGSRTDGISNPSSTVNQNAPPTLLSLTLSSSYSSTMTSSLASSTTDTSSATSVTNGQNSSSSDSGGGSAGLMIGVMLGATILIVAFIIFIVRRKVDSLRGTRRSSHKLHDTEYNDIHTVGQPYYEKRDYTMDPNSTVAPPDTAFLDPSSPGAEYNHQGNRVSFAPMASQRQSIYRQSTGTLYQPPTSLMPVNGRFIPAGNRQSTFASYHNYNPYSPQ